MSVEVDQDCTMERVHMGWIKEFCKSGQSKVVWGPSPVASRGKAPVGSLGDEVLQKMKQNTKLFNNFLRFPLKN